MNAQHEAERLSSIRDCDLSYLVTVALPRQIEYETAVCVRAFDRRHNWPISGPESAYDVFSTHHRMLKSRRRTLEELRRELSRRSP